MPHYNGGFSPSKFCRPISFQCLAQCTYFEKKKSEYNLGSHLEGHSGGEKMDAVKYEVHFFFKIVLNHFICYLTKILNRGINNILTFNQICSLTQVCQEDVAYYQMNFPLFGKVNES